ncbi:hypothetical protein [Nocardioides sp.]
MAYVEATGGTRDMLIALMAGTGFLVALVAALLMIQIGHRG